MWKNTTYIFVFNFCNTFGNITVEKNPLMYSFSIQAILLEIYKLHLMEGTTSRKLENLKFQLLIDIFLNLSFRKSKGWQDPIQVFETTLEPRWNLRKQHLERRNPLVSSFSIRKYFWEYIIEKTPLIYSFSIFAILLGIYKWKKTTYVFVFT